MSKKQGAFWLELSADVLYPIFRPLPAYVNPLQSASMSGLYQDAVDYLYSLVNFEHRRIDQYSPENISLDRPARLLGHLGNPHMEFRSIHIAGTKGKGSVAAMCAAALRASGYKVGLYTSPHLQDFRDRIRVLSPDNGDGRIGRQRVVELVDQLRPAVDSMPGLTWYELVTAIAFLHFAREDVDIAVVEVGLGGRLDATNLLMPLVSVITSLSLDHTYLLGDTLAEIASEKAGIIKPNVPVVTASQAPEALNTLAEIAGQHRSPLSIIGRDWNYEPGPWLSMKERAKTGWRQEFIVTKTPDSSFIPTDTAFTVALAGRHQLENALVSLAVLNTVRSHFPNVSIDSVSKGLSSVIWPGRLQVLAFGDGQPMILADCAHNVDSAEKLAWALSNDYEYQRLWLILGATADKDVKGILEELLPISNHVFLTASSHPRANSPGELLRMAKELGHVAQPSPSVTDAVTSAWQMAGPDDLICVTGSIFLVGDLLNNWEVLQSELTTMRHREMAKGS